MLDKLKKIAKALGVEIIVGGTTEFDTDKAICQGFFDNANNIIHLSKQTYTGNVRHLEHILLHEICHATGSKKHLDRPSLEYYFDGDLYTDGEEQIAYGAVLVLESLWKRPSIETYEAVTGVMIENYENAALDFDEDIATEIERIVILILNLEL